MPRIRPWLLVVIILIGVGVYLAITSFGPKPKQPAPHQRERATPASEQAKTQLRAAVLRDAPETVETDLEGLVGIAGTVLSPDGEPLPQAEIWGWYPGCIFYRRKTDEDGRFKFERDVPWGTVPGEYFILAEHPKYAWAARGPFTIEANHALKDFTIRLNEGGFVAGVVRDEDGIPVKNATVWFQTCAQPKGITDEYIVMKLTERKGVSTDERGTYTSIALLPGTYVVGAEHRDLFDAKNQTVEILAGETITGVDLVLGNGVSVSGRVTDLSGIPLPGAKVSVWMENAEIRRRKAEEKEYLPDHDEYIRRETLTDETGSFLLRGLEPGPCHVHAGDADFYSDRRFYIAYKAVTAPAEDIMFQLEPLPCIKGLVIDETNRAPI